MNLIPRPIRTETFDYYSPRQPEDFKADLQAMMDRTKKFFDFSANLSGSFCSENEFDLSPKWQLMTFYGTEGRISYLHGEILPDPKGSLVRITVRPNLIFPVLALGMPIITLVIFAVTRKIQTDRNGLIAELSFLVGFPLLFGLIGWVSKFILKNRFVRIFELTQVA